MRMYFVSYTVALVLSVPLMRFAIWLGQRLGLTDIPDIRKVHHKPVPCIGGVGIFFSTAITLLLAVPRLDPGGRLFLETQGRLLFLGIAATAVFLLGWLDDVKALRARQKLLVQCLAATLVYYGGIRIGAIVVGQGEPIPMRWMAWPVTVIWIVGITNAVNLSDGVDGLAGSVSMIACGVIAALAIGSGQVAIAVLMLSVLGALTGFLWFNFPPARIFLGDSGSLFLGFVIAVSSILCFMSSNAFSMLALPAIALGIPIFDTLWAIARRFAARRPILAADRDHFHHRLLRSGLGHRQVVALVCVSTLIVTGLGTLMLQASAVRSVALIGGIVVLLMALFCAVGVIEVHTVITGLQCRLRAGQQTRQEISELCRLQLRFDEAKTPEAWWEALCYMAGQLDFAWISIDTADTDGNVETHLWRCPEMPSSAVRLTIVKVPVKPTPLHASVEIEAAVPTNGSVESAIRRALLLGRLIDEFRMPAVEPNRISLDPMISDRTLKAECSASTSSTATPRRDVVPGGSRWEADSDASNAARNVTNGAIRIPVDR